LIISVIGFLVFVVEHYVLDCHWFSDINISHGSVVTQ